MGTKNNNELVPCPTCEGSKVKGKAVCYNCKKQYIAEGASLALEGNPVPRYEDWIIEKLKRAIPALQKKEKETQEKLRTVKKEAEKKLHELLLERLNGRKVPLDIFQAARLQLKETEGNKIWKQVNGPASFRDAKIASLRLQEAKRLLEDLRKK